MEVETGVEQRTFLIGEGEKAKSMSTVEELCRGFARFGLTRADLVVGVGGGVVTDVAGFAAAVYHRGVAVAHVATTLLGQVDAAIGGKTGVNLPEGKNLVGAFWQPVAVICDTEVLATLPPREYRSGLGEMAKYAFLGRARAGPAGPGGGGGPLASSEGQPGGRGRTGDRQPGRRRGGQWPGPAQLRPHFGPRPRDGRANTTCATVRRWPSGSYSPPGWLGSWAEWTTNGWPSTTEWWPPTTSRPDFPPGSTWRLWSR